MDVQYQFKIVGVASKFRVVSFGGTESLSDLFRYTVVLAAEGHVSFSGVIGRTARLSMMVGRERRVVHGVISRFEEGDEAKGYVLYEATIEPRIARLLHRADVRIFQDLTVPKIIEQVLASAGIQTNGYRFSLSRTYAPRDYCVQYRETDLGFIRRLMEQEGMTWFFDNREDEDVLVIVDSASAYGLIVDDMVRYRPSGGALASDEHISRFRYGEELRSGKVTLRDYDFKRPNLVLQGERASKDEPDLEVYDYPGAFESPSAGADFASIRLGQAQSSRRVASGRGACLRMEAGRLFLLRNHPNDALNHQFLLTKVVHRGEQPLDGEIASREDRGYECSFECVPEDAAYKPTPVADKPIVQGPQTAIVVGPSGEEIFTDEHGRVKVQFHWDRRGKRDEHSSCWIRVSQGWAGAAWGAMYIPRVGHEVIVEFLEGDPDRPIITGRVYHGTNVPPYPLPAEKSKSTLKSSSTPRGNGSNELRFEDKQGEEQVYLHAQRDWDIQVERDKTQGIGRDESLIVGRDRSRTIGHDERAAVGNDQASEVKRDRSEQVGRDARLEVGRGLSEVVRENRSITVGRDHTESIASDMRLTVGHDRFEVVQGASDEHVVGSRAVTVDRSASMVVSEDHAISVHGKMETRVDDKKTVVVGEQLVLRCGDGSVTLTKNGDIVIQGKDITIQGAGPMIIEGKNVEVKSDGVVNVDASGQVNVKAAAINMN